MNFINYTYPEGCPGTEDIKVKVNGEEVFVWYTKVSYIACVSFEGSIEVEVEAKNPITSAQIRPLSRGEKCTVEGDRLFFTLEKNGNLSVEIEGMLPLLFSANPIEGDVPSPEDEKVHYFKTGRVYEVGQLWLNDDETLYIEGGAVVRGYIRSNNSQNIKICGRGVLDGSIFSWNKREDYQSFIQLKSCTDVEINGITMVEPPVWMIDIRGCRNVHVDNVKQVGIVVSSDGVDVVSCRDVLIENCFLHNNDDCVVVKAFPDPKGDAEYDLNVDNIVTRHCVFVNDVAGNAVEIGHELRCDTVRNIAFKDCDILLVKGCGAAFSIHNGDHATVSDVLYEDIRVEHYYDRLMDFRVMQSRFNLDKERGQIKNVHLRNIKINCRDYNPGYSISLIGGFDREHTIEGVVLEDVYLNDKKVTSPDELDIHTRYASKIEAR